MQSWTDDKSLLNLQRRAHILWEDGQPSTVLLIKKDDNSQASEALEKMGTWSDFVAGILRVQPQDSIAMFSLQKLSLKTLNVEST